jgi:hypothetical protein
MQGTTAMSAQRLRSILVLLGVVQSASCVMGEGGVCSTQLVTTQAGDSSFAGYPAGATVAATMSATGNVTYSGASASRPTSSKISLQIAWDQSSVSAPFVTCPDGNNRWQGPYEVPVKAKLTTADGLFSETLTGTVDNAKDNSGDQMVHFKDLALSDLQGTFGWRDVSAWSTASDACTGAILRFGMLLQKSSTKAITLQDALPGFINVECPSRTTAPIVFSAVPTFN